MSSTPALSIGFPDPVLDAQQAFHALMQALARPGSIQTLRGAPFAPEALGPALGAVALTLLDFETRVWLDPAASGSEGAAAAWLRFHTGTRIITAPDEADFALVTDCAAAPPLDAWRLGEEAYPDRSTTLAIRVAALGSGPRYRLTGPGIKSETVLSIDGLPSSLVAAWPANRALFPRGVDVLLVGPDAVAGLPRTTRIEEL